MPIKFADILKKSFFLFILQSCAPTFESTQSGLNEAYQAYIPARIAVIPCREWPVTANFKGKKPFDLSDESITGREKICEFVDENVLKGFANQPFMKGFSPKLVLKLIKNTKKEGMLEEISLLWKVDVKKCEACRNAPTVYNVSVKESPSWRKWLNDFSHLVKFSDALLIPFIVDAYEHKYNDRGVLVSERVAKISLMLIDTNNGDLVWSQEKSASVLQQKLPKDSDLEYAEYPPWEKLNLRLFTDDLWRDFPGRI